MATINLSTEEIQIIVRSITNCLSTCHEGGPSAGCPDCTKLQGIQRRLQSEI